MDSMFCGSLYGLKCKSKQKRQLRDGSSDFTKDVCMYKFCNDTIILKL